MLCCRQLTTGQDNRVGVGCGGVAAAQTSHVHDEPGVLAPARGCGASATVLGIISGTRLVVGLTRAGLPGGGGGVLVVAKGSKAGGFTRITPTVLFASSVPGRTDEANPHVPARGPRFAGGQVCEMLVLLPGPLGA